MNNSDAIAVRAAWREQILDHLTIINGANLTPKQVSVCCQTIDRIWPNAGIPADEAAKAVAILALC